MSYLRTIIDLIEQLCNHDKEFEELLKSINIKYKENLQLRNQIEELSKSLERRQIEYLDLKSVVDNLSKTSNVVKANQPNVDVCYKLKRNVENIDFTKAFQYEVLQTKEEYAKDWQQIQQAIVKQLTWQEKMSQRNIVQKYNFEMDAIQELQEQYRSLQSTMTAELQKSKKQVADSLHKRNMLICDLVKDANELNKMKCSLPKLRKLHAHNVFLKNKKNALVKELKKMPQSGMHKLNGNLSQDFKIEMPKFPSIDTILKNLGSTTLEGEQMVSSETISKDNTTCLNYCLDETLNQQVKPTKNVHFKVPLHETKILVEFSSDTNSTSDPEASPCAITENIHSQTEASEDIFKESEQHINSLNNSTIVSEAEITNGQQFSSAENVEMNSIKATVSANKKTVSPIHIQECIVIKPTDVETVTVGLASAEDENQSLKEDEVKGHHNQTIEDDITKLLPNAAKNRTKSTFALKDFEDYLSQNKSFIFNEPSEWNTQIALSGEEMNSNDFKFDANVYHESENNSNNMFTMDFSDDNADVTDNYL